MPDAPTPDERASIVAALSALAPGAAATEGARRAVIAAAADARRSPRRWMRPALRFALPAAGAVGVAAVLVLSLPRGGDGRDRPSVPPGPQAERCQIRSGQTFRILPLRPAVAVRDGGVATLLWNAFDRTIRVAEPAASASTGLSGPGVFNGTGPALAQNARGDAVAAWIEGGSVVAAFRAAGGGWGDTEVLGAAAAGPFAGPAAVVAADGTATVAWPSGVGLAGARRTPGGGWSRAMTDDAPAADPTVPGAAELSLAVGADGTVAAVWMQGGDGIGAATWPGGERSWTPTQGLLGTVRGGVVMYGNPGVAAAADGFVATFVVGTTGRRRGPIRLTDRDDKLVSTTLPPGAARWTAATRVSRRGEVPSENTIAGGPGGEVAIAWLGTPAPGTPAYRKPGFPPRTARVVTITEGRAGPATAVPGAVGTISSPGLALERSGRLTVVWTDGANRNSGRNSAVMANTLTPGAGWGRTRRLSDRGTGPLSPAVATDAAGNAAAAWMRCDAGRRVVVQFASRPAGGSWTAATRVE